jgi:hypothetical protein
VNKKKKKKWMRREILHIHSGLMSAKCQQTALSSEERRFKGVVSE